MGNPVVVTRPSYAGIGSRDTPTDIYNLELQISARLARSGWTLRTGGARGSDTAFLLGSHTPEGYKAEVYLPGEDHPLWPHRQNFKGVKWFTQVTQEAYNLTQPYIYGRPQDYVRRLIGRNGQIILGWGLSDPVKFVVCWTPGGQVVGGTAYALRLCADLGIPVLNLGDPNNPGIEEFMEAHGGLRE